MDKAMVTPTNGYRVLEARLTAIDPVLNMVRIDKALVATPGELASAVAVLERSPQCRGDHPSLTTDIDGLALRIRQHGHDPAVAKKPPGRFRGDPIAIIGVAAEVFRGDVDNGLDGRPNGGRILVTIKDV